VIAPARGWVPVRLGELWEYRELLAFLVWREIKVRYKQAALGILWAVIQPVMTMVLFTVVFGRIAHMPSDGLPYPVFAFTALLRGSCLRSRCRNRATASSPINDS
jgi:lipopolysaccharide transport system permease protein